MWYYPPNGYFSAGFAVVPGSKPRIRKCFIPKYLFTCKMWSNFHTHAGYCDGKGTIVEYLETCRRVGVRHIGFTSHAPIPFPCKWCMKQESFPVYLDDIREAKKAFPDIEVYRGLEVDFIPGVITMSDFASKLDFTVGSIHFVDSFEGKYWEVDNTRDIFEEGLEKIFNNDIRKAIGAYYARTREMVLTDPPDIVGHMDKIKINSLGTLFEEDEPWYIAEIDETLKAISETKAIVEVNTRGLYKKRSETTYPSPWILDRIREMRIPITLNSDSHHPDELIKEFDSAYPILSDIGFKAISVLKNGTWTSVPLTEYGK